MLTIRSVRSIITAPRGLNLVVVKVETSEPELYGLGCATFTQRARAVHAAITDYLAPLLEGRDPTRIEETFRLSMVHGYWRNGPVLNNAISGVDMALWDITGKRAGLPVYDLLGGRYRQAARVYRHAEGRTPEEVAENVSRIVETGVQHVRVQCGGYGGQGATFSPPEGALEGAYYDPRSYMRDAVRAIAHVRERFGDKIELLHDVHERLAPAEAVEFAKELERYRLFFLEDLLAPEDIEWFANVRAACTTPLAMGELFNHPREWTPLITGRQIDFIRMHMSQMGGITPARKVAATAELHGVRTAWHGPADVSPVGHAANVHLDLTLPNFGIQEFSGFTDEEREVFPGCPEQRGGHLYVRDVPGLGIDLDEAAAKRFPPVTGVDTWTHARLPDGSLGRP